MFDYMKNNENNSFYPVSSEEITNVEKTMGIFIPAALKSFYLDLGYGFLETKEYNINRIMDPQSVAEFRLKCGQFNGLDIPHVYEEYTNDKLIFFEVNESLYLSIGITKNNNGEIFYYNELIANSLEEFFNEYLKNEKYFFD